MTFHRRLTDVDKANPTITPYTGSGLRRSCGRCLKHKPPTGGTICKRTSLWICRACKPQQKQP